MSLLLIPFKAAVNLFNSKRLQVETAVVDVSVIYQPRNLVPAFEVSPRCNLVRKNCVQTSKQR